MTEKDLKKLFEEKLEGMDFEFNPDNWDAFEQMADPNQPLSEQEFSQLFKGKEAAASFAFNPSNWEAFEQMNSPQEPLSEQEFKKLFREKMAQANFPFNPANWEAMEEELGPENGMSGAEFQTLFQNKAAESRFAFNPENWARMEAILDQRAVRPLAYFWRSAAAILLMAAVASTMLWQNQTTLPTEGGLVQEPSAPEAISPETKSSAPTQLQELPASPLSTEALVAEENPVASSPVQVAQVPPSTPVSAGLSEAAGLPESNPAQTLAYQIADLGTLPFVDQVVGLPNLDQAYVNAPQLELPSFEKEPYIPLGYSRIYAVAGPAISAPMNGKMGTPGWQAGLEYEYGWSKSSAISTGLIYNRSGDIGLETMHDSTFFGLGRTDVQTHRHYKNLSSLRIPLNYRYTIANHGFGVGFNTDVLLNVNMDETKTTTVFKQDPVVETTSYSQPMETFSPVNFSASFTYYYQYSERLSLALSYAFALNDLTNDNAQNFEAEHRPGQANLQLRYRLFEE